MKAPHKHAALIKAWADGAEIEMYSRPFGKWMGEEGVPSWDEGQEYRIKPEREYPKSSLTYNELCNFMTEASKFKVAVGTGEGIQTIALNLCADAAVKRYIQDTEEQ